jgi:hypothetical protein
MAINSGTYCQQLWHELSLILSPYKEEEEGGERCRLTEVLTILDAESDKT